MEAKNKKPSIHDLSPLTGDQLYTLDRLTSLSKDIYKDYRGNDDVEPSRGDVFHDSVGAFGIVRRTFDPTKPGNEKLNRPWHTEPVAVVVFKGTDDAAEKIADISKLGVKGLAQEAKDKIFKPMLDDLKRAFKGGNLAMPLAITGHSLGGYLASEFALYLREELGEAWWKKNCGKIELGSIDSIGVSDRFVEVFGKNPNDPTEPRMKQSHFVVEGSIACKSRSGNGLHNPIGLPGGVEIKCKKENASWHDRYTGLERHGSGEILKSVAEEITRRQQFGWSLPTIEILSLAHIVKWKGSQRREEVAYAGSEIKPSGLNS